jgi:hypothetical protein
MSQRVAAGKFRINGIDLAPASWTVGWGKQIIAGRAEETARAIERAIQAERK